MKTLFFTLCLVLPITIIVGCFSNPTIPTPEPFGSKYVQKGKELVKGLAACGACHGATAEPDAILGGGRVTYDKYGEVKAPNLTPSLSGIGDWSAQEISSAIRFSVGRDEEPLSKEVHSGYRWMSDEDVYSIIAYLRTLTPIDHSVERRSVSFVDRYTVGLLESHRIVAGYVPPISLKDKVAYGKYVLENVARCASCHNSPSGLLDDEKYLDGGREINISTGESKVAPNITNSKVFGIGSWTEEEIVNYLRSAEAPGNKKIDSRFCPTDFYQQAFSLDLYAIASYLKTVNG